MYFAPEAVAYQTNAVKIMSDAFFMFFIVNTDNFLTWVQSFTQLLYQSKWLNCCLSRVSIFK